MSTEEKKKGYFKLHNPNQTPSIYYLFHYKGKCKPKSNINAIFLYIY